MALHTQLAWTLLPAPRRMGRAREPCPAAALLDCDVPWGGGFCGAQPEALVLSTPTVCNEPVVNISLWARLEEVFVH